MGPNNFLLRPDSYLKCELSILPQYEITIKDTKHLKEKTDVLTRPNSSNTYA